MQIKKWKVRLVADRAGLEIMMGSGSARPESTLTVLKFHLKAPLPHTVAESGAICQYAFRCNLPAERKV